MADLNDLIEDSNAKLSRRNVVVGTAWAVPTIMAVGAAPAMAISNPVTMSVTRVGRNLTFRFTGPHALSSNTVDITAISGSIQWNNAGSNPENVTPVPFSPTTNQAIITGTLHPQNAATGNFTVTFVISGSGSGAGTHTATFNLATA